MSIAENVKPSRKQRVRTLWISDVHLGTRDCQAEHLSGFLKQYHADKVYLVDAAEVTTGGAHPYRYGFGAPRTFGVHFEGNL